MDWQAAATQLLNLVLVDRSYPPDFDWEREWPNLLAEFRDAAKTDGRIEQLDYQRKQREADLASARAKITAGDWNLTEVEKSALQTE
ncbi:MAG: hypothetical protein KDB90_12035 [Planctomycetes bacterium]|nr:hypothetical protein [Planctomycetota bacterium]